VGARRVRVALCIAALGLLLAGCIKPDPNALRAIGAVPPNSGNGARIVYRRNTQQVWVLNAQNQVIDQYRSSGHLTLPAAGHYRVYQKQPMGTDNSGRLGLPFFIVFSANIGFHGYPIDKATGRPIQSDAQLGQALSHGCVRLADAKIKFLWNWAAIGTPVVVL
jgi:hypothetical protein